MIFVWNKASNVCLGIYEKEKRTFDVEFRKKLLTAAVFVGKIYIKEKFFDPKRYFDNDLNK